MELSEILVHQEAVCSREDADETEHAILASLRELQSIHAICLDVANCPPVAPTDSLTLRYVKDLAHLVNSLSESAAGMPEEPLCIHHKSNGSVVGEYVLREDYDALRAYAQSLAKGEGK